VIRLAIVDDQALVREGLSLILGSEPDIEVVADVADGDALLRAAHIQRLDVDVVLLDLYLPGADGVGVLRELRTRGYTCRVLILTTVGSAADVQRALAAGPTASCSRTPRGRSWPPPSAARTPGSGR
jgi:DNA-binding NarL/FixJ family response regulator